jgi:hypothetical protein
VTGLFLSDVDRLREHHIGVFDEVLVRLMECADARTLTRLSAAFADLRLAPKDTVRCLARHEDAAVAAPILLKSEALSDHDLVEIAQERGQAHLLAIARRKMLNRTLTDILLTQGDTNVCRALARNPGAQFSNSGFGTMVDIAACDDEIADSLVRRSDTPREVLSRLVSQSTRAVQTRLLKIAPPEIHEAIQAAIDRTAAQARAKKPGPTDYSEAKSIVLALNNAGRLNDSSVNRFAIRCEYKKLIAALSLLAAISTETVEVLMEDADCCGLAIACRASRLNRQTTAAIISSRKCGQPVSAQELAQVKEVFESLCLSTAQRTIRFGSVSDFATKCGERDSALAGAG